VANAIIVSLINIYQYCAEHIAQAF